MSPATLVALACLLTNRVVQSANDSSDDFEGSLKITYSDHPHPASNLPQVVHYQVTVNGTETVVLRLRRRALDPGKVPVFSRLQGQFRRVELPNATDIGFYQGEDLKTAVTLKIKPEQNATCHDMSGTFHFNNSWIRISPTKTEHDARGNRTVHLLRKLSGVQSDFSHARTPQGSPADKLYTIAKLNAGARNKTGRPGRARHSRQTQPRYDVGILLVVDYSAYKRIELWLKLINPAPTIEQVLSEVRLYCAQAENQVDIRYRSIDPSILSIGTTLKSIYVETSASGNYWLDKWTVPSSNPLRLAVDSDTALSNFKIWLLSNLQKFSTPSYDHASLLTGYDLIKRYSTGDTSYDTSGIAYLGSACTDHSASVIELAGALGEGHTLAHELGHSLGATHDGEGNTCLPDDQYIMTASSIPTVGVQSTNTFHFSSCSQVAIANYIATLNSYGTNCLLDDEQPFNVTEWAQDIAVVPGQRYSASEQCKQVFGSTYSVCGGASHGSNICEELWCYDTTATTLKCTVSGIGGKALDGTPCGDKKWCNQGTCVYNSSAPSGSDTCPLGDIAKDIPVFSSRPYTCSNMPAYYCYDDVPYSFCCKTCAERYNPTRPDCPYGDRADCSSMNLYSCRFSPQNSTCCGFCSDNALPIAGCPFGDTYSNCKAFGPQICRTNPVECCATCAPILSTTASTTVVKSTTVTVPTTTAVSYTTTANPTTAPPTMTVAPTTTTEAPTTTTAAPTTTTAAPTTTTAAPTTTTAAPTTTTAAPTTTTAVPTATTVTPTTATMAPTTTTAARTTTTEAPMTTTAALATTTATPTTTTASLTTTTAAPTTTTAAPTTTTAAPTTTTAAPTTNTVAPTTTTVAPTTTTAAPTTTTAAPTTTTTAPTTTTAAPATTRAAPKTTTAAPTTTTAAPTTTTAAPTMTIAAPTTTTAVPTATTATPTTAMTVPTTTTAARTTTTAAPMTTTAAPTTTTAAPTTTTEAPTTTTAVPTTTTTAPTTITAAPTTTTAALMTTTAAPTTTTAAPRTTTAAPTTTTVVSTTTPAAPMMTTAALTTTAAAPATTTAVPKTTTVAPTSTRAALTTTTVAPTTTTVTSATTTVALLTTTAVPTTTTVTQTTTAAALTMTTAAATTTAAPPTTTSEAPTTTTAAPTTTTAAPTTTTAAPTTTTAAPATTTVAPTTTTATSTTTTTAPTTTPAALTTTAAPTTTEYVTTTIVAPTTTTTAPTTTAASPTTAEAQRTTAATPSTTTAVQTTTAAPATTTDVPSTITAVLYTTTAAPTTAAPTTTVALTTTRTKCRKLVEKRQGHV